MGKTIESELVKYRQCVAMISCTDGECYGFDCEFCNLHIPDDQFATFAKLNRLIEG